MRAEDDVVDLDRRTLNDVRTGVTVFEGGIGGAAAVSAEHEELK